MDHKTIYALSTAWGKSGVAIVRISGAKALDVIKKMTDLETLSLKPRHAYYCKIFAPVSRETLDNALLFYFKAPNSFTGEDCVEIHCHGSKAVISSILEALSLLADFRLAEPGEFSKRAFYNQKMDLTEAEGLADLIDSETSAQQQAALRQVSGSLKLLYDGWREKLLEAYSYLEAFIDFPEENISETIKESILNTVFKLIKEIDEHLATSNYGERLRDGFQVVIAGPANAGKSSLLNTIARRKASIVSDIAGTTRDAVDVYVDVNGLPVIFTDTAGLRETTDEIEQQGVKIAQDKISQADLVLALFDASKDTPQIFQNLQKESKNNVLYIANKVDTLRFEQCSELKKNGCLLISAKHNQGIEDLLQTITDKLKQEFKPSGSALVTRARYRQSLTECLSYLRQFSFAKEIELSAEDLRLAARELGKITGRIDVNEVLDKIFGSFCIGK